MNVDGKNVVVTGRIAGESRATAEARLRDAGATVQSAVNGTTDLLVIGEAVGAKKTGAAADRGVQIVRWDEVWSVPLVQRAGFRDMNEAAEAQELVEARALDDPPAPVRTIAPMLCKKADAVPTGAGWLFEVKWDGYRCTATVIDGRVTLQSRSAKTDYASLYPQIVAELAGFPDCIVDGELVDLSVEGGTFEGISNGGGSNYVVYDLLEVRGEDVRGRSLVERRLLLDTVVNGEVGRDPKRIALSPVWDDGDELLGYAAANALEGIVAKRAMSTYREGSRGEAWLKIKLRTEQEFVVVGFTPGEGARAGMIGSLLLAVNDGDRLVYCGRVGTGGDDASWDTLHGDLIVIESRADGGPARKSALLDRLDTRDAPRAELRDVTWVVPTTVVQVAFQRWTTDGRLIHPSVKGRRFDKDAGDVVRET